MLELATCRSLMFVPAHVQRFVEKAAQRGADAIVLDLEDSVPPEQKQAARHAAAMVAPTLASRGVPVLVRINSATGLTELDIEVVVGSPVSGIVLPKVDSASQIAQIASWVAKAESGRGLPIGHTKFIAQVESVEALSRLDEIASALRVEALNLGAEDFCVSTGGVPVPETLLYPMQMVLFAARRARISPIAPVYADFKDRDHYRQLIRQARNLGYRSAFCVHPDQAQILNEQFAPSKDELATAQAVVDAYEKARVDGRGAASLDGKMIDAPVVARARSVLASKR
jgi:citrate lyase subunit beta/citryl-CoA lyase